MAAMSNYLEEKLLNHIFRTNTYSQPTTVAIALLTTLAVDGDTGEFSTGSAVEVTDAGAYARVELNPADANWTDPSAGTQGETDNASAITFPTATDDWGTIVGIAIVDSSTHDEGNLLFHGELATEKVIGTGDTFQLAISGLKISLN